MRPGPLLEQSVAALGREAVNDALDLLGVPGGGHQEGVRSVDNHDPRHPQECHPPARGRGHQGAAAGDCLDICLLYTSDAADEL